MKVIITGANGFVGRHLIAELQSVGYEVAAWDRSCDGLPPGVENVCVDITKPKTYQASLSEIQPDWIIHLAAFSNVGESFKQPELVREINVEGTRKLLENARALSPKTKVLAVSSADIYGKGSTTPLPELNFEETLPMNPYAASKLEMERLVVERFNDFVIRVRPFPHIGPGQKLGFVTADFASQVAAVEKSGGGLVRVGNLEAQRDFTDVRDVVRAYRLLLEKGRVGEVYHVASGKLVSIREILDRLLKLSATKISVVPDPNKQRPSDVPALVGDASKLKEATGWQPQIALDQSLADILSWWRQR